MRYLGCVFILLALISRATPTLADSPQDPVRAVYRAAAAAGNDRSVTDDNAVTSAYFTQSFQAVLADIDKRARESHQEILDFDPVLATNGDVGAEDLAIRTLSGGERGARVQATFGKANDRRSVVYVLRRENDSWRIDDIQSPPGARGSNVWSVRTINDNDLKAGNK